jgi:oligoendopeptidase F
LPGPAISRNMSQSRCWALLVVAFVASASVSAQIPTASAALSADLSRYYFKTPAEEVAALAELNAALDRMGRFKGQLNSESQLLGILRQYDVVQKLFAKHEAYLHLRCALNRKDAACDADKALESDVDAKTAFLDPEILALPEDRLRVFLNEEPALAEYRFALSDIRRAAPHLLSEAEQTLLDQFQPQIGGWQYDLYEQVVAGISFGTVQTSSGPLDVVRQRNLIAANADGRVREEGFKRRYAGFASQRDLLAFALLHTVDNVLYHSQIGLARPREFSGTFVRDAVFVQVKTLVNTCRLHGTNPLGAHLEYLRIADEFPELPRTLAHTRRSGGACLRVKIKCKV